MTDINRKLEEMAEENPAFAMWLSVSRWQSETDNEMPAEAQEKLGNVAAAKDDVVGGWNFLLSEDEGGLDEATDKYLATLPELKVQQEEEEDDG